MKRLAITLAAVLPLLTIPAMAAAQKLETGKWTGTVVSPEGERVDVSYDVTMKGDTIAITANAAEHGSFLFNDVKLADRSLTFWFTPGPRVECTLARRDDGAYDGTCKDSNGGIAQMTMMPPKKG